jgi:hypothetical protein
MPLDSKILKPDALFPISQGDEKTAIRLNTDKSHYYLEFEEPLDGQHCWYAFIGHWQIESANPEADPVISFAQKPKDRGKQIKLPGLKEAIY